MYYLVLCPRIHTKTRGKYCVTEKLRGMASIYVLKYQELFDADGEYIYIKIPRTVVSEKKVV